jgi:phosphoglucomutase
MNENTAAKKGKSDFDWAVYAWIKYAEILESDAHALEMSREFTDITWKEYAETFTKAAYARGRAEGLREALRILGREE